MLAGLIAGGCLYYYFFFNFSPQSPQISRPVIQYNDAEGKLYFVDSLEKVPDEYRSNMRNDLPAVNRADYKIPGYLKQRVPAKREKRSQIKQQQQQRSTCPLRR